ncbi:hypothetical protein GQ457_07G023500 [Hibiscus cannabinus]
MVSDNTCSCMQSSDDEEKSDSVPACLNSNPISNPHPSLVSHHQSHPPTFFDPSANFLNPFSQSQVENLSQRSEPNCTLDFGSSSSQGLVSQGLYPSSSTSMQSRPSHDNGLGPLTKSDQKSGVKNPKKRTRASRTAPTTIITTDTMNFRAIVQEFTGIPAPPFPGSSYPYSPRLDLFGLGSMSGMRYSHLETLGSLYALRPSAKRMKPIPIVSSSPLSLLTFPLVDANITIPTSSNYKELNSCKMNYSALSSGFQHDEELENVSSKAKGRVESWICPA